MRTFALSDVTVLCGETEVGMGAVVTHPSTEETRRDRGESLTPAGDKIPQ